MLIIDSEPPTEEKSVSNIFDEIYRIEVLLESTYRSNCIFVQVLRFTNNDHTEDHDHWLPIDSSTVSG